MASSAVLVGPHILYYNGAMSAGGNIMAFNTETGRSVSVKIDVSSLAEKPVPAARLDYGICAVGVNKICLFGGKEVGGAERLLNDIWFLELRSAEDGEVHGSWSEVGKESTRAHWPATRRRHAMAARFAELFVIGGETSEGPADGLDCWKFDLSTSSWQPLFAGKAAKGPLGRHSFFAGVVGENLWCMGGLPTAPADAPAAPPAARCDSLLCFNLVRREWTEVRCFGEGDRLREASVWGVCEQHIWAVAPGAGPEAFAVDAAGVLASAEREAEQAAATVPDKEDDPALRGLRRRKKGPADKEEPAPDEAAAKRRRRTLDEGHLAVRAAVAWSTVRCSTHAALPPLVRLRAVACTPGCGVVAAAASSEAGPEVHVLPNSPLPGGAVNPFSDADALAEYLGKQAEELRPRGEGEDGAGPLASAGSHDADEARSEFSLAVTNWPNCGSESGRVTPTDLEEADGPAAARGSAGSSGGGAGEAEAGEASPGPAGAALVPVTSPEDYRKATQFASALAEHIAALQSMQPEFEGVGARIEGAMAAFAAHRDALQAIQRRIGELQSGALASRAALGGMRLELLKAEGAVETAVQRVLQTEEAALLPALEEAVEHRRRLYDQELATLEEQMRLARDEADQWGEYAALSHTYAAGVGLSPAEVAAVESDAAAAPPPAPLKRSGSEGSLAGGAAEGGASMALVTASPGPFRGLAGDAERLDGEIAGRSRRYGALQEDFRATFSSLFSALHSREGLAGGVAACSRDLEAARGEEEAAKALLQDWARKHLALASRGRADALKSQADLAASCQKLQKRSEHMREVEGRRGDPALRESDWAVHAAAHSLNCLRSKIHELEQQRRASPAYRLFRDVQEQIEECQRPSRPPAPGGTSCTRPSQSSATSSPRPSCPSTASTATCPPPTAPRSPSTPPSPASGLAGRLPAVRRALAAWPGDAAGQATLALAAIAALLLLLLAAVGTIVLATALHPEGHAGATPPRDL
eukprot:tig00020930_g16020.t1